MTFQNSEGKVSRTTVEAEDLSSAGVAWSTAGPVALTLGQPLQADAGTGLVYGRLLSDPSQVIHKSFYLSAP
jgi:hypothetical protein